MSTTWPEIVDGLPNLMGDETALAGLRRTSPTNAHRTGGVDFGRARSGFACALHMHQPLIPAGGTDLRNARIIGNLQHMVASGNDGERYNAGVYRECYRRMGEFIPMLLREGKRPRILLEYSGTLLYGLRAMGADDVLAALLPLAQDPDLLSCVEWLGAPWGHAVAPSTPVQDFRMHVQAYLHFFGALFGPSALERVRGFSPSEMALPNHPDVAYAFVKTLRDFGFRYVLVQEHTVEQAQDGGALSHKHLPHRLVVKNSEGESIAITAIVKTQGSDTKLVAQMQPYYEAKTLAPTTLGGQRVPPLVLQIADGENGGVMMNEFPSKFIEVMREASDSDVPPMNISEYLDHLESLGVTENDFPDIQPIFQHRLWQRFEPGSGPAKLDQAIVDLRREDTRFHLEGGSWTNNLSWVRGYESVLVPMDQASAAFARKAVAISPTDPRYREALFHLLCAETSCFRYWGQGIWTDYGRELAERTIAIVDSLP